MFSKGKAPEAQPTMAMPSPAPAAPMPAKKPGARSTPSIISSDLLVQGALVSQGDMQIDGTVEGDIRSVTLMIGNGAVVKGEIVGVMHMDDEGGHDSKVVVHVPASEGGRDDAVVRRVVLDLIEPEPPPIVGVGARRVHVRQICVALEVGRADMRARLGEPIERPLAAEGRDRVCERCVELELVHIDPEGCLIVDVVRRRADHATAARERFHPTSSSGTLRAISACCSGLSGAWVTRSCMNSSFRATGGTIVKGYRSPKPIALLMRLNAVDIHAQSLSRRCTG